MSYGFNITNVLRILGSNHPYSFEEKSELNDVKLCIGHSLCEYVSTDIDTKHVVRLHGRGGYGTGVVLTDKGRAVLEGLVDDRRFK